MSAGEAKSIGLVNKVASKEKLMNESANMANSLAKNLPLAIRAAKETIHQGYGMTLDQGLDLEIERWSYLCGTEDQKEGAAAFIEKRKLLLKGK